MTFAAAVAVFLIGAAPQAPPAKAPPKPGTVTHDGCVAVSQTGKNAFTLDEEGQTYVLKGVDVRDFVGKRVQVVGAASKRLRVVGGLYPSANVAAQGSSIDPTKAAMAAQSGPTSQSARPSIEFNVKSVRLLPGSCAEAEK